MPATLSSAHADPPRAGVRGVYAPLAAIFLIYLCLALGLMLTRLPASNEAWFADPALDLLRRHTMGTPILEGRGTWLEGIDRFTYWSMPLYFLVQAVWYVVLGFDLFRLRLLSVAWGAFALIAWWVILHSLEGNRKFALLGTALIGVNYSSLQAAAIGRMDIMCAALGFGGIAAYLHLRKTRFEVAVLSGQAFVAASCFTHPCGALPFLGLQLLILYFDLRRISWKVAALSALPYLIGSAAWGAYIAQNPTLFLRQFMGNINGVSSEYQGNMRFSGLTAPWTAIVNEVDIRYLREFGGSTRWRSLGHAKLILPLVWFVSAILMACVPRLRSTKGRRALLLLAGTYFFTMAVFEGMKFSFYLVHSTPVFCAVFAAVVWSLDDAGWIPGWLLHWGVATFLFLQIGLAAKDIKSKPYQREFLPAVEFLKNRLRSGSLIIGPGEFAFAFGFNGAVVDDVRLGYFSQRTPDFIVTNNWYRQWFANSRYQSPSLYWHIQGRLAAEYSEVFRNDNYVIWARRNR